MSQKQPPLKLSITRIRKDLMHAVLEENLAGKQQQQQQQKHEAKTPNIF